MSFYHRIRVFQKDLSSGTRVIELFLDTTREGALYENSAKIPIKALEYWELAPLFLGKLDSALVLGGGTFTLPTTLLTHYPQARVEVVEIDPAVVAVGRRFFNLNNFPDMHIFTDDARRYLNRTTSKYDLIFGDAYNGLRSVPSHLLTREFFQSVKNRLADRGIFMLHIINTVQGHDSALFLSVIKTLSQVFPKTYVFASVPQKLTQLQGIIIVATDFDLPLDSLVASMPSEKSHLKQLLLTYVAPKRYNTRNSPILSDSFNPVEYLVAQTLQN
ncbi:MAG: fused MFS/spermidine synthase, partial [Desulfobaccales bacterium]